MKINSSDTTKARLLSSGADLFCKKGYSGVSVREICKHAETSINMIHHYFGSKEGFLNAIIDSCGEKMFAFPMKLLAKEPKSKSDFISRIELVFETTLDTCIENRQVFMITIREQISSKSLVEYTECFKNFMEIGKRNGFVRKELDIEMTTGFMLDRITNQVLFAPWIKEETGADILNDKEYLERWSKSNVDLFINGIAS